MSVVQSHFVTFTCDSCSNTATIPANDPEAEKRAMETSPWLNAVRFISTPDGRKFVYCSDICELKGVEQGLHNKKVIIEANEAQARLAAQAAQRAAHATSVLKDGTGGNITLE